MLVKVRPLFAAVSGDLEEPSQGEAGGGFRRLEPWNMYRNRDIAIDSKTHAYVLVVFDFIHMETLSSRVYERAYWSTERWPVFKGQLVGGRTAD